MMATVFFLLVISALGQTQCPTAPTTPGDRRTDKTKLRIATFNAEWLFPGNDGKSPWTTVEADAHLDLVAKVVAKINPDVLNIQEVKDCTMLNRLITAVQLHGVSGYVAYERTGTDTATGQNVGMITKVDIVKDMTRSENRVAWPMAGNTCKYTGTGGTSAVSKHYIAPFTIGGVPFTIFNHHFLAFPTQADRCAQREAQASVMRGLIDDALNAKSEVMVFGDYNDYSDAVKDSANNVPTSRVMKILRDGLLSTGVGNKTELFEKNLIEADATSLVEISRLIDQPQRYTSAYNTYDVSQIDHILVSQRLYNNIISGTVYIDHSYDRFVVSDHWPLILDIKTPFA